MNDGSQFLAAELERLMQIPLSNKSEVGAWYDAAEKMKISLAERFPGFEIPHEVRHFLTDADIRARDASYGLHQEKIIVDYIKKAREAD